MEWFMVQLAIVVFFGLFATVEIYQSVKNIQLPLPVYLALGIALAVVSNLAVLRPTSVSDSTLSVVTAPTNTLVVQEEIQVVSSIDQ
jgi:asparagine N-glycosylation enzyme membrane subunit Stt3